MAADGASCGHGRGGREGARWAEGSAGGGRSLKQKSRHSGKFWFSDPMVRPDPVIGYSMNLIPPMVLDAIF